MAGARALVVGAGIIGVCAALALTRKDFRVTIIDPEPPGTMTSYGNAGGFGVTEVMPLSAPGLIWRLPKWLIDPLGPVSVRWRHLPGLLPWLWRFHRAGTRSEVGRIARAQAALLAPTYEDYKPLLRAAGISDLHVERGGLTVYKSEPALARDALEWETKRGHGIRCERVGANDIRALEPALSPAFVCGIYAPQWSHVRDPYRVVTALASSLESEGGRFVRDRVRGFEIVGAEVGAVLGAVGGPFETDCVVVAAGAWSASLARQLGSAVPLESERGYNTTLPEPGVHFDREVIFAEDKFVMTPMDAGLRIGGAAEFAGLDAPPDFRRSKALLRLARRYVPGLNPRNGTEWMGHRPSLPDSLPVISRSPRFRNVLYAFGHGHLGLTQAATTGRLISSLAANEAPSIDLEPFRVDRF